MENRLQRLEEIDKWFVQKTEILNYLDNLTKTNGLSYLQYDVLFHIQQGECSTPTEIAATLHLARTSISRVLKNLQSKELIEKSYGQSNDQRQIDITLTEKAKQVLEEVGDRLVECDELKASIAL